MDGLKNLKHPPHILKSLIAIVTLEIWPLEEEKEEKDAIEQLEIMVERD